MKPQNLILDVLLDFRHKEIKRRRYMQCKIYNYPNHHLSFSSIQLPTTPNYSSPTNHPPKPKTSAVLNILILVPHNAITIDTTSTVSSTAAPTMNLGQKIL